MLRPFGRRWILFVLAAALGCGPGGTSTPGPAKTDAPASKGVIGVSVMTHINPFFKVIGDSISEEAGKHGYRTIVVSGDNDVGKQQNQIKDFIVQRVSAIVLCPCDSKAIGPAVQEANAAGIPVFTADLPCTAEGAKVVCNIATDNYQGGQQAGQAMIEALGPAGGKVVILDFKLAESCRLRVKGFHDAIAAHNKDRATGKIDVVAELPGDGHKDKGYKAAEDSLLAHPDLAGIFAINDPSGLGARAALEKAGKASQVKIIAFDGQPEGKQAIKEGKIYADPIQYPDRIGRDTVQVILKYFDGEQVPAQILIPTALYRQADGLKDPTLK